ncbi:hypothetical protein LSAT2_032200 [Lamellibrachia satsuma]|nr:hypothetical protein LSAT2_032200 [Lamellibrachia satsuma]
MISTRNSGAVILQRVKNPLLYKVARSRWHCRGGCKPSSLKSQWMVDGQSKDLPTLKAGFRQRVIQS